MNRDLIIIGGGGQANVIIDAAQEAEFDRIMIEDPYIDAPERYGVEIHSDVQHLVGKNSAFVIAVGDNFTRCLIKKNLQKRFDTPTFATIVHPSAVVSSRAKIGYGSVICGGVFIGPESIIGDHVILNTNCSVDHDCKLSDFSSIGPNAVLGGNVKIGMRTAVAISATVSHGLQIGNDNVIGAGALVTDHIFPDNTIWYGIPAKYIKDRKSDEKYL